MIDGGKHRKSCILLIDSGKGEIVEDLDNSATILLHKSIFILKRGLKGATGLTITYNFATQWNTNHWLVISSNISWRIQAARDMLPTAALLM